MFEEIKQKAFGAIFHFDMKEAREIAKEIEYRISMKYNDNPKIQWLTTSR